MARDQFVATVAQNTPLCREHYRLTLKLPDFPATRPGQFIQIACRDLDLDADVSAGQELDWQPGQPVNVLGSELIAPLAMLRRPFSLAGRRGSAGEVELDIIHRVVGIGTDWMSRLSIGDRVFLLGPLGNTFTPPAHDQLAILVGGGVGIPPMLYLAEQLAGRRAVAFCGALTRDLLPLTLTTAPSAAGDPIACVADFSRYGIPSVITTDDGSAGYRGYVTQALEHWLDTTALPAAAASSKAGHDTKSQIPIVIYTCGPELMMKRVADIAADRNIDCQIAVERAMACGMGTCQSCCIRVRKPDPARPPLVGSDWCYRLACTDGPVFRGSELLW